MTPLDRLLGERNQQPIIEGEGDPGGAIKGSAIIFHPRPGRFGKFVHFPGRSFNGPSYWSLVLGSSSLRVLFLGSAGFVFIPISPNH